MSTLLLTIAAIGALVAAIAIIISLSGYMHRRRFDRAYHAALRRLVTHQQRDRR